MHDLRPFIAGLVLSTVLAVGSFGVFGGSLSRATAASRDRDALFGSHADAAVALVDLADEGERHYLEARMASIETADHNARALGADDEEVLELRQMAADQFDEEHAAWRRAHTAFGLGVCDYVSLVLVKDSGWNGDAERAIRYTLARYEELRDVDERLPPMPSLVPAVTAEMLPR